MKSNIKFLLIVLFIFSFNISFGQDTSTDLEWKFYEMAERNRVLKKYKTAIAEYENAILLNAKETSFYIGLGLCYAKTKQFIKAADNFEKTLELDPNNLRAYNYLLKSYQALDYQDKVVDVLDRWSKNSNELTEKLAKKTQVINLLYDSNELLDALKHSQEALEIHPQHIETLHLHAKVNNKIGNYAEAKVSSLKAADLIAEANNKTVSQIYYELGYSLHHLKEYDAKDEAFAKVSDETYRSKISRLYAPYYTNLATVYTQMYEFNIAQSLLKEALKIDEHYSRANKLYAQIEDKKPTNNQAKEEHKREVIELYRKSINGILAKIGNDKASAEESLIKELYKDYRKLIELKILVGEYTKAITTTDEAMQFFSTPNYIHKFKFMKAIAMFKQDDNAKAVLVLRDAIDTRALPNEYKRKYSFVIGHIQHRGGDLHAAKHAYRKAFRSKYGIAAHYGMDNIKVVEHSNGMVLDSTKLHLAQLFTKQ